MSKLFTIIKKHKIAIIFATLIGIIYITPYFVFRISLGDKYQGIPMLATANEDFYIARVQEIIDGHPLISSVGFYEYKDQMSLTPPTAEMFYAIPSLLLGIPLVDIIVASRFILPFILFLLVYYLIYRLTINSNFISNKFNAIAGAVLVTLGYDLVDYHNLWLYLTGQSPIGGKFLIWARLVNPILGAIFLFSFLICIWLIIKKSAYKKIMIFFSALFLALMIASYFFSWGVAVSVLAVLILMYLIKKEFEIVKSFFWVIFWALTISLPYWYMSFIASQSPSYKEAVLKNGLFNTHYPLFNRLILAVLLFYLILFAPWLINKLKLFFKDRQKFFRRFNLSNVRDWNLFCLALLLGSFWVFTEQVVTGMTIWPFHFVQYTIPLAMVVAMTLLYNVIKGKSQYLWLLISAIIFSSSVIFGIAIQAGTYRQMDNYNLALQAYKPVFNWLNQQKKDSVVLVAVDDQSKIDILNGYIPAFTHSNIYASNWAYNLIVIDRDFFNYLVLLRLKGVSADNIEEYLKNNKGEAVSYLFSNWSGQYNLKQFPDFTDNELPKRLEKLPEDYRQFVKQDFSQLLKKYQLDYILSSGPLKDNIKNQLQGLKLVEQFNDGKVFIYSVN
ncbi:MAG: hypothetical protein Q7K35_02055 [bacterium]|nr:hypothetical protein [bacterium]